MFPLANRKVPRQRTLDLVFPLSMTRKPTGIISRSHRFGK